MLTEAQLSLIENGLSTDVEPRKVAAYFCLHMGLMLGEVAALRVCDVDLSSSSVTLSGTVTSGGVFAKLAKPRTLLMPPQLARYFAKYRPLYEDERCYILGGGKTIPPFHLMQNVLTAVAAKQKIGRALSASDLRNAFIRRLIEARMDLYSICAYVGIKQPNVLAERFGDYFKAEFTGVSLLDRFSADYTPCEPDKPQFAGPKRMNLLILGAGSQGPVVKEIAEAIGIFEEIAFLDDDENNPLAIGPLNDINKLAERFPMAIASFGDSYMREKYMDALESYGYIVPSLVHPNATLSPNAKLERSVVIEARCIVSSGAKIGRGALLSSASVIETNASVGKFSHIGSSVTVAKSASVEDYARVPSGTVVR